MAQVPYNPAPSVGPSGQVTPFMRVPGSVGEAAGVGVAQAIKGLGNEVSQAGDMLAGQALRMQHMVNESTAKNGDVSVYEQIGAENAQFDQLEGDRAVAELPKFQERIKKIREDALASMPNDMTRKMLDQSISRQVGFALINAGHKAATQAKVATKEARGARIETYKAGADFGQAGSVMMAEQAIRAERQQEGEEAGQKQETIDNNIRKDMQTTIANGIMKNAYTNPELAKDAYERYKDKLDEQHRNVVEQKVNQGIANVQTRVDQEEIFKKLGITGESGEGKEQAALNEADKYIEKKGKDNPLYADALRSRIKTNYATVIGAFRDQQHGDMTTLAGFIGGKTSQDRIMSMDALMGANADPQMSKIFDSLTPQNQRMVSNWVRDNARGDFQMSATQMQKYLELRGQYNDPAHWQELYEKGPDAIMSEKFPAREQRELLNKWLEIGKKPATLNNVVDKSIREPGIEQMIVSARIRATSADSESKRKAWFGFRGALEDAQQDWINDHKTPAKGEDLRKMVSGILTKASVPGMVWGKNEIFGFDPANADSIPKELRAMIVDTLKSRGNKDPDANAIARQYSFELYKKAMQDQKTPQVTTPDEKKLKAEQSKRGFSGDE